MGAGCSVDRWGLVAEGAVPSAVVVVLPDPPDAVVRRLEGATSVDVHRFSYSRSPAASRASSGVQRKCASLILPSLSR
jgi:hypothetical protein